MSEDSLPTTSTGEAPTNTPPPTTDPNPAADPASSLRAAALLTLKAKRRSKPASNAQASVPPRPQTVDNTPQLDYGQETNSNHDPPPSAQPRPTNSVPPPPTVDMEDGQIREEGEISDSDEPLAKSRKKSPTPPPPPPATVKRTPTKAKPVSLDIPPRPATPPRTSPVIVPKMESPQQPLYSAPILRQSRSPNTMRGQQGIMVYNDSFIEQPYFGIDANHVRPGLQMNQAQYDTAKDIVLDLLGWGVPPEYLVDCGLSREIVFYVFGELNLRLPDNLDTTGLVPYIQVDSSPLTSTSALPPSSSSYSLHPSLPAKPPQPPAGYSPQYTPAWRHSVSQNVPSSAPAETSANTLLDMERQRRQELLARKAVQASRKPKAAAPPPPVAVAQSSGEPQDVEMVPVETVDDFLNSIGPAADPNRSAPQHRDDSMDVDDVPGLSGGSALSSNQSSLASLASFAHQQLRAEATVQDVSMNYDEVPVIQSPDGADPPPTSADSTSTVYARSRTGSADELTKQGSGYLRRQGKRPVAADFVDMDPRQGHGGSNGRHHHHHHHHAGLKKSASFAGVSVMRRCIINVSDSEEDGDGGGVLYESNGRPGSRPASVAGPSGVSTPSYATGLAGAGTPSTRTMSPAMLLEKEHEIMRMRQVIAEKEEQNRSKKRQQQSSTATPSNAGPSAWVKQEEVDSRSLSGPSNGSIAQPIPQHDVWSDLLNQKVDPKNDIISVLPPMSELYPGVPPMPPIEVTSEDREETAEEPSSEGPVDVEPSLSPSTQRKNAEAEQEAPTRKMQSTNPHDDMIYRSPFDSYPLLRSRAKSLEFTSGDPSQDLTTSTISTTISSDTTVLPSFSFSRSRSSSSSSVQSHLPSLGQILPLPDLKHLRLATLSKVLDPSKRVCPFEIPGGGVCRDDKCEHLHLSRITSSTSVGGTEQRGLAEPTDEDTANYLATALPADWASSLGSETAIVSKITSALHQVRLSDPSLALEVCVAKALIALGLPLFPPSPPT